VTSNRRLAIGSLVAGLLVVASAQAIAPQPEPPLYDGVVPLEPYVWAAPPPDHPAGAQGASASIKVKHGKNELVAVATPELSPQAQVFAAPGGLTLPGGATSVEVSITPMAPTDLPAAGYIDGNVYRISVTDQAGNPISADASQRVSVILRSADPNVSDATISVLDGTTWQPLKTSPPDMLGGGFLAVVTGFGDFAVVASGVSPYPTPEESADGSAPPSAATSSETPTASQTASPVAQPPADGSGSVLTAVVVVGGLVAAAIATLLALVSRRRRDRRQPYRGARPRR
jgi:hypothetical protein